MYLAASDDIVVVAVADQLIVGTKDALRVIPNSDSKGVGLSDGHSESVVVIQRPECESGNPDRADEKPAGGKPKVRAPHNVGLEKNRSDIENTKWFSAISVSQKGNYIAAADNSKILFIYQIKDERGRLLRAPILTSRQNLAKRSMALTFTKDEKSVVVSDKLGDVYVFGVVEKTRNQPTTAPPILGHISVITDVVLSPDEKFILTGDRDEKVRVSHFPLADDIQAFCLGHTKYVTRLLIPSTQHPIVLSASGDSTVRAFNYLTGEEVGVIPAATSNDSETSHHVLSMAFNPTSQTLFVAYSQRNEVSVYKVDFGRTDSGVVGKVTFRQHGRLAQRAGLLSLCLVGDDLVTLHIDVQHPLSVLRNASLSVHESSQLDTVELEQAVVAALVALRTGEVDSALRDPFVDLFSATPREVGDEMDDVTDGREGVEGVEGAEGAEGVENSAEKKEGKGCPKKRKKGSGDTVSTEGMELA